MYTYYMVAFQHQGSTGNIIHHLTADGALFILYCFSWILLRMSSVATIIHISGPCSSRCNICVSVQTKEWTCTNVTMFHLCNGPHARFFSNLPTVAAHHAATDSHTLLRGLGFIL